MHGQCSDQVLSAPTGKLPVPQVLLNIKPYVDDPESLIIKLKELFAYIKRYNLLYPSDIQSFIGDPACKKWVISALEEYHTLFSQSLGQLVFDQAVFIQNLVAFVTGEVRPRHVIALEELMSHDIVQGSDLVTKYAERFHQRTRILTSIPQSVFCRLYLTGLQPDLKILCCVDREGKEWHTLSDLVQYSFIEERRLKLRSGNNPPGHVLALGITPTRAPKRSWTHAGKQRKLNG